MKPARRQAGLALLLLAPILLVSGVAAGASDIEVAVTGDALQRMLNAALPYKVQYAGTKDDAAAEIVISNPKVILIPGRPGSVLVNLDYTGQSKLLGIEPFSGQTRPRVAFEFDPRRAALRISLQDLVIVAGNKIKFKADQLVAPVLLPLTPPEPLALEGHLMKTTASKVSTEVQRNRLLIKFDYRFIKVPLP
ncbi:MAG: hypothetical protein V1816_03360 [Pseudomonadota bacterium]